MSTKPDQAQSRWQRCRPLSIPNIDLADDPIHKLLLGRDPVSGAPLASQPTISRFENGAKAAAPRSTGWHTFADLIGQRIFGIACGHPDGNDADHLADELLLGRPGVRRALGVASISRFENGASRTALYRMGRELAACVIERHRRRLHGRARRVTIDLDPTDDLTHGGYFGEREHRFR